MKQCIIALVAITAFACTNANAQHKHPFSKHAESKYKLLKQQLRFPHTKPKYAAKTTATDVRMVSGAELEYESGSYKIIDSIDIDYTGSNGGLYDERWQYWDWQYSQALIYPYNMGTSSYDPADTRLLQHFNASGQVDTQHFQQWNSGTSSWDNSMRSTYTWDASGNMLTERNMSWISASSAWQDYYRVTYSYTSGNLTLALREGWNTSTSAWQNESRTTNTWDASNRLITEVEETWSFSSSAWQNSYKNTFTYDGSGNRTIVLSESWNGAAWENSGKVISSDFVMLHQPQKEIFMMWNSTTAAFDTMSRDNYIYNTYGKPDHYYEEFWNSATSGWEIDDEAYATRYHYETYTPASVEQVTSNNATVDIYPTPATTNMNVFTTWNEAQRYKGTITDATGRLYMSWTSRAMAKTHQEVVSVADLPSGNYVLTLRGDKGRIVKQFTVMR